MSTFLWASREMAMKFWLVCCVLISEMVFGETFTATWENGGGVAVTHYNTQYRLDTFTGGQDSGDGFRYLGPTKETEKVFTVSIEGDARYLTFRCRACNEVGCSEWAYIEVPVNTILSTTSPPTPYNLQLLSAN